jgi:uncharacterized membrane protein YkvA (DUF1232 family)
MVNISSREHKHAFLRAFGKRRSTFWQMTRDIFSLKYRPRFWTAVALLLTVSYIIFPYDFVADYDSAAGFLDDILVLAIFARILFGETHHYIRYKAMSRRH